MLVRTTVVVLRLLRGPRHTLGRHRDLILKLHHAKFMFSAFFPFGCLGGTACSLVSTICGLVAELELLHKVVVKPCLEEELSALVRSGTLVD